MAAKALLSLQRECEIEAALSPLLARHGSHGRIDPEAIATSHAIRFAYASFPETFDGHLVFDDGRFFIICNDRLHPRGSPRSRFTLAHELGHYFLHKDVILAGHLPPHFSRVEVPSDDFLEADADFFASRLLLPADAVRQHYAATPGSPLARIAILADHFGTSLTATAYRVLGLGLLPPPAALFRWDNLGRLESRRLSPQTATQGGTFLGLVDAPPPGSLTARSIEHLAADPSTGETHAMAWFPRLSGHDPRDQTALLEHVQPLGHYGWLTLVCAPHE